MHHDPDDEFKLRFPVARDQTLRRIAIIQMTIGIVFILSLLSFFTSCSASMYINNGNVGRIINYADVVMMLSIVVLIFALPAICLVGLINGIVHTHRYGWRAVQDPIEAQRIAVREALYDVATGSAQAMPEHDNDRLIVEPARQLRPVRARLELTAERDKAQAQHKT